MTHCCHKCGIEFEVPEYRIRQRDWICTECRRLRQLTYRSNPAVRRRNVVLSTGYQHEPRNRHKVRARRILRNAITFGRLTRKPCERCGRSRSQAHHPDYARPLDVQWLCSLCHAAVHREEARR